MQNNKTLNPFCSDCRFVIEPSINENLRLKEIEKNINF